MRSRYAPPDLDRGWLNDELLRHYPGHKESRYLLEALVEEYFRFWRLVLNYPEYRVVAPGPIMAVQLLHYADRGRYFGDCMRYYSRFIRWQEFAWYGRRDFRGTIDTVRTYIRLYDEEPPGQWRDITDEYNAWRPELRVVQ